MRIKNGTNKGYIEVNEGGLLNYSFIESEKRRGRVIENGKVSPTIDCKAEVGLVTEDGKRIKVRRLTPRECFRLQGFPDEYFERAAEVNSDTQLYKQAGNSVTVNVIYEIAKRLK